MPRACARCANATSTCAAMAAEALKLSNSQAIMDLSLGLATKHYGDLLD